MRGSVCVWVKSYLIYLLSICALGISTVEGQNVPLVLDNGPAGSGWRLLSFGKSKQNSVSSGVNGLKISVNGSAGLMAYGFGSVERFSGFRLSGSVDNLIKLEGNRRQGARGSDDYVLRIGMVIAGDRKLSTLERRLAPAWIHDLVSLCPRGTGLGGIRFYNVENGPGNGWSVRNHPLGRGMMEERIALSLKNPGAIMLDIDFGSNLNLVGLWISCDGDDTNSRFTVTINHLEMIR